MSLVIAFFLLGLASGEIEPIPNRFGVATLTAFVFVSGAALISLEVGTLGYLHAPDSSRLRAAVVGLGTGITAGILGRGRDMERVSVLEISPAVIDAARFFQEASFKTLANPKIEFVRADAFRYLTREAREAGAPLDLIVSEPSNPWVVGVENLFTLSFYALVKKVLRPEGVFVQWLQLYEIDRPIVLSVLSNLVRSFKHLRVYQVGTADIAVVASQSPLSVAAYHRRFSEPEIAAAHAALRILQPEQIEFQALYDTPELIQLAAAESPDRTHDFETPTIGYAAGKQMFLGRSLSEETLIDDDVSRVARYAPKKARLLERLVALHPAGIKGCGDVLLPPSIACARFDRLREALHLVRDALPGTPEASLLSKYQLLRESGFYPPDRAFLLKIERRLLARIKKPTLEDKLVVALYLQQLAREGYTKESESALARLRLSGAYPRAMLDKLDHAIKGVEKRILSFGLRDFQKIPPAQSSSRKSR